MNEKKRRRERRKTKRAAEPLVRHARTVSDFPTPPPPPSGLNAYKCEACGRVIVTRHHDLGVTPMFLACRATANCPGQMVSSMYPQGPLPPELAECPVFDGPAEGGMSTFSAPIPDEPPEASVVLDCEQIAWQRREGLWHPTQSGTHANCRCTSGHITSGHRLRPLPWTELLIHRGPLVLLTPEESA